MPPAFSTVQVATCFQGRSSPGQTTLMPRTQQRTAFLSTSSTALKSLLRKEFHCSQNSACLATPVTELDTALQRSGISRLMKGGGAAPNGASKKALGK
jgi:hypothetical protein